MEKITIIGIDDEYPALVFIEQCCARIENVELLATFQNPEAALAFLQNNRVDLMILDINMPYLNGIELLQKLEHKPLCVFFTLETNYAVKAFELDVVHYLVKPVDFGTFEKAVKKAADLLQFRKSMERQKSEDFIMFKSNYLMHKVYLKDILWVEGLSEYIVLVTAFKKYIILERMSNFVKLYERFGFIRIHKSYIVLQNHIKSFSSGRVHLLSEHSLPLGRTFKEILKTIK